MRRRAFPRLAVHMQEEKGITAGEIARIIKRRIFWVILIAAAAAVAAALYTAFVYNRAREEYALTFVVEFPQETPFRYETVIYADNLESAKASDEAFSDIDTEHMAADEDISILRMGGETESPAYMITAAGRYFSDRTQATKFLRAVVEHAVAGVQSSGHSSGGIARQLPAFLWLGLHGRVRICAGRTAEPSAARVMYRQNVVSVIDNGASPVLAAFAGFAIGFLLAGFIFCAADYPKVRRGKSAQGSAGPARPGDGVDNN